MRKLLLYLLIFCVSPLLGQQKYSIARIRLGSDVTNEFSPMSYADGIVFCSDKRNLSYSSFSDDENRSFVHLYYSEKVSRRRFSPPELLPGTINSFQHDGPISFSTDGQTAYYSRTLNASTKLKSNTKVSLPIGIYIAQKAGDNWLANGVFDYNSTEYNVMHPSLSADGKYLYFSSDMPGGKGGYDIYYCENNNGKWGEPINAGSLINTEGNEVFPYIHASGRLFFSSDKRPQGMGGLDIYFALNEGGSFTDVKSMNAPFNSRKDDFGFCSDFSLIEGYFSSNRRGSDDLFMFSAGMPDFEACEEITVDKFCFVFYENGSIDLDSTTLIYEWDMGDGSKVKGLEADYCFKDIGMYFIQLNVIDTLTGEVYSNEASMLFEVERKKQVFITSQDTVVKGQVVDFDAGNSNLDYEVDKYFWDFGDDNTEVGEKTTFSFEKPGVYMVKLGAVGFPVEGGETPKTCGYKLITVVRKK